MRSKGIRFHSFCTVLSVMYGLGWIDHAVFLRQKQPGRGIPQKWVFCNFRQKPYKIPFKEFTFSKVGDL